MIGSGMNRMGSNSDVGYGKWRCPIALRGGQLTRRVADGGESRELAARSNPLPMVRLSSRQLSDLSTSAAAS